MYACDDWGLQQMSNKELKSYPVWDLPVRLFHWINVLCVLGLVAVGTVILFANSLGVSADGKVTLKIIHAWIGYVFTFNLLWRLVHAFFGNANARWSAILPGRKGYFGQLKAYVGGGKDRPIFRGHNPLGRIMITVIFALLTAQMVTGLVLAGTDLYFPPFGHEFAEWATGSGEDHSRLEGLRPGAKEMLDPVGYAEMRKFREPFISIHKIAYYLLLLAIAIHVTAVIVAEIRERQGLVSAMFTGEKVLDGEPED